MEALSGLLALASELNMTCIEADVFRDNLGGKRALQKLGFAEVARVLRLPMLGKGPNRSTSILSI